MFSDLMRLLSNVAGRNFDAATDEIVKFVNEDKTFVDTIKQIGTIPESLDHDSTEEKLFSKASDAVLARSFREIGLKARVLKERGDSADVLAESKLHGYSLVADAKAFRMSRTAKNQKDFKVTALSGWRNGLDYAVLCSPYFQYPTRSSQIYAQAIEQNVCLMSWEHMIYLIENGVVETPDVNIADLWNYSAERAKTVLFSDRKDCFLQDLNRKCNNLVQAENISFNESLSSLVESIKERGETEKKYWVAAMDSIKGYSKEKAITELIKSQKIEEKIAQINAYVGGIRL